MYVRTYVCVCLYACVYVRVYVLGGAQTESI
jgi:hypothetical protein